VTVFLAGTAVGLLGYSVMWQAPNLRMEIAQQSAKQELKNATTDHRLDNLEKDVKLFSDRLTMLAGKQ
jgi:Flp pilus assembly protein TadB